MGDPGPSDSWQKLVIAKANDQWVSINSNIKQEQRDDVGSAINSGYFSLDYEGTPYHAVKKETDENASAGHACSSSESFQDPLLIEKQRKHESFEERSSRLSKMSAYAAQRLANETPEQRAIRLKRMSEYAAKRLASETSEQRAKRLSRMSAYAAKRLAQETPEQRTARLSRMSAYAAKRQAIKKMNETATRNMQRTNCNDIPRNARHKPDQSQK